MNSAQSGLDRPAARLVATTIALAALGLAGWLGYIDNREDPLVVLCIKERSATLQRARDSGRLAADVVARFLDRVAASCRAEIRGG